MRGWCCFRCFLAASPEQFHARAGAFPIFTGLGGALGVRNGGATVLAVSNSVAYLESVDLSGCEADPIAGYDGAVIDLKNVSGAGNSAAGSACVRLRRGTIARNNSGNSVTAALGDVQVRV